MSWAVCKTCRHHLVLTENTGQTFFTTSKQKPVATAERLKGGQRAEDKLLEEQTGRMNIVCKTALFRAYVTSACIFARLAQLLWRSAIFFGWDFGLCEDSYFITSSVLQTAKQMGFVSESATDGCFVCVVG